MDGEGQNELIARLEAIEERLEALTQQGLMERLARMEDKLMLITDIERYQKLQGFAQGGASCWEADDETVRVIMQEARKNRPGRPHPRRS